MIKARLTLSDNTQSSVLWINKPLHRVAVALLLAGIPLFGVPLFGLLQINYSSTGVVAGNAFAQSASSDTFTLNLKNVDIRSLIQTVSRQTGRNFIVDPRVKATVTVVSSEPVNAVKLYEMFLSILDVHGYAAVPAGSVTKIVPMATGVQSAVPVVPESALYESGYESGSATATKPRSESGSYSGAIEESDELVTRVVEVEYVPAQQLIQALRPLLPETASFSAEKSSNTVIITDSAGNIDRVVEIIRLLDRPK